MKTFVRDSLNTTIIKVMINMTQDFDRRRFLFLMEEVIEAIGGFIKLNTLNKIYL